MLEGNEFDYLAVINVANRTDVHMGLVSLENGSIGSGPESVVSEYSVNGIDTTRRRSNMPRRAE